MNELLKVCTLCHKELPCDQFVTYSVLGEEQIRQLCTSCRIVRAKYTRKYSKNHPEKLARAAERKRQRYYADPEIKERAKVLANKYYHAPGGKEKQRQKTKRYLATAKGKAARKRWEEQARATGKRLAYNQKYTLSKEVRHRRQVYAQNRVNRMCHNGGSEITPHQWELLLKWYGGCCAYCGVSQNIIMEHVIPLSRGGWHDIRNIVPACALCNRKKHSSSNWIPRSVYAVRLCTA